MSHWLFVFTERDVDSEAMACVLPRAVEASPDYDWTIDVATVGGCDHVDV